MQRICSVFYEKNFKKIEYKVVQMSALEEITLYVNRLQVNAVFSISTFVRNGLTYYTARKALDDLEKRGIIHKLDKGRYYKTQQTMFGEIRPPVEQAIGDLLVDRHRQVVGYLTGTIAFNQMGLTTQISSQIQIGRKRYRKPIKRGEYSIAFIVQRNTITRQNIPLLQILDALRFVREIPDTIPDETVEQLMFLIGKLSKEQQRQMINLALLYTPYVRALLGAILEKLGSGELTNTLKKSLNDLTHYNLHLSEDVLPTKNNWNIR